MTRVSGLVETSFEAYQWVEGSNHSAMDMVLWLTDIKKNLEHWQFSGVYEIVPDTGSLQVYGYRGVPDKNTRRTNRQWIIITDGDWVARIDKTTFVIPSDEFDKHFKEI